MRRNDLRNAYPFHNVPMRQPDAQLRAKPYNRHSLTHKVKALYYRTVRNFRDSINSFNLGDD